MTTAAARRLALIETQLRALATRQEHLGERSMSKRLLAIADQVADIASAKEATKHE